MLKDEKGKDRTDSNKNPIAKEINLTDIMDNTFADYEVYKPQLSPKFKPNKVDTLKGEFTPTQAKRFFEKYDILIHQPNTESGFSATSFGKEKLQIHSETKKATLMTMAIRTISYPLEAQNLHSIKRG